MDGEDGAKRWLILETPAPEEKMVAAALIFTGDTPGQVGTAGDIYGVPGAHLTEPYRS